MTTLSSVQQVGRPDRWTPDMVYIGMPGRAARAFGIPDIAVPGFGKPWACKDDPRGWQIAYREYLWNRLNTDPQFRTAVRALHGKTLLCWCTAKGNACHGEILIRAIDWLNSDNAR